MSLFTDPTVLEVQDEVKLRPEQVRSGFLNADYAADVADRISEESAFVAEKISARFGVGEVTSLTSNAALIARKLVELRAAASLYHSAGQLNERYKDEALDYERRADERMDLLMESIGNSRAPLAPTTAFSTTLGRRDGYSRYGAEYTDC
jgi:hypothetical protein